MLDFQAMEFESATEEIIVKNIAYTTQYFMEATTMFGRVCSSDWGAWEAILQDDRIWGALAVD